MEIYLDTRYTAANLVIKADNVCIEEDIQSRVWEKDKNGKISFLSPCTRDIKTESLQQISNLLMDMIYYRNEPFDSSSLVERLFEKLPQDIQQSKIRKLVQEYKEE